MKKMTTLFKKDPKDLGRVINEINEENRWVLNREGIATRKFDGSACAIINGELYKRYDAKKGKKAPEGAIPCQEPDEITGHHPHWVKCDKNNPADKYFIEAFNNRDWKKEATYELCGEKINANPEKLVGHHLIEHGSVTFNIKDFSFDAIKLFLEQNDIEGIVFHHLDDDRMCKIRKSDFGLKR